MNNSLPRSQLQPKMTVIEPYLNAVAIFILATVFLLWDASRAVFVLLSLAALVFVLKYRPSMPSDHRYFSWPIIGFAIASLLSILFNERLDSGINYFFSRTMLLLIAVPLVSVFYLSFDSKRNAWIKFAVGCMVLGGLALVDVLILDKVRADGGHNASAFGFTALAMTSVVLGSFYRFNQSRPGRLVFCLAVFMGICAMILSGTRTSMLSGFAVLVIALFFYLDRYSIFKRVMFMLILFSAMALAASTLPIVQKRFGAMIEIVAPYVKGEEQTEMNSLRTRVELWKAAWDLGGENPVFGLGAGNTKRALRSYVNQNPEYNQQERTRLLNMAHIHNQFLQTFAMSGLLGLFSLITMVLSHLWLFTKYLGKQYSREVRCFALSGVLLLVAYLIKSIPGVPFFGKQYLLLYGFASAAIWGGLLGALRLARHDDGICDQD